MSRRLTALDQALLVGDYEKAAAMMVHATPVPRHVDPNSAPLGAVR